MSAHQDTYTHGHHESVLRSHNWRTVENSARYLIEELRPGRSLLDIGCGPGTITVDFASRVHPAPVLGVDNTAEPLESARARAGEAGLDNVTFEVADVYRLPHEDAAFDLVHAHQVLQHLTDPVAALREMRRVCRPDGTVAVREVDFGTVAWYPELPALADWLRLYYTVTRSNDTEANAGRRIAAWARQAGFTEFVSSADAWCFADAEQRRWWGGLWADRVRLSSFAEQALGRGLATEDQLAEMSAAWQEWAAHPDGWFAVLNGEILARPGAVAAAPVS